MAQLKHLRSSPSKMKQSQFGNMTDIKIKPLEGQKFKEFKVSTKNWNLETRRAVNKLVSPVLAEKDALVQGQMMFDIGCDISELATTLTEEEIFNMSFAEIVAIGFRISDEINKKK